MHGALYQGESSVAVKQMMVAQQHQQQKLRSERVNNAIIVVKDFHSLCSYQN